MCGSMNDCTYCILYIDSASHTHKLKPWKDCRAFKPTLFCLLWYYVLPIFVDLLCLVYLHILFSFGTLSIDTMAFLFSVYMWYINSICLKWILSLIYVCYNFISFRAFDDGLSKQQCAEKKISLNLLELMWIGKKTWWRRRRQNN